jgi:hypothetical protein
MLTLAIGEFLSGADKVIGLLKGQQVRRREYFDKIIDPMYTQFAVIGEDYLKLLREARSALENVPKKLSFEKKLKLLAQIRDRREEFLAGRLKVRAMVQSFQPHVKKEKDRELFALLLAMDKFFYGSGRRDFNMSVGSQLVDLFSIWATENSRNASDVTPGSQQMVTRIADPQIAKGYAAKDLTVFVSISLQGLETAWFEAAGRYADLRLKYLGNKLL